MSLSSLILSYKKCVKYANELTDDVVRPTQYYIRYVNQYIYSSLIGHDFENIVFQYYFVGCQGFEKQRLWYCQCHHGELTVLPWYVVEKRAI